VGGILPVQSRVRQVIHVGEFIDLQQMLDDGARYFGASPSAA
jgi:hypothetical protein